jgi:putative ABC transport system permease protein
MSLGRFLVDTDDYEAVGDDLSMRNVCVLGSRIAEILFPFEYPLGQTVVINRHHYIVVGVVSERMPTGGSGGSQAAEEFNNDVYIPYRTSFGRFGTTIYIRQSGSRSGEQVKYNQITLKIDHMDHVEQAGIAVRDWLQANHYREDWAVTIPLDRLREAERTRDRYMVFLFFIALISLLVGGIGIMNIMLATVTERTREIGIRRALGAKRKDIILQFLIEAVAQTTLGGLLGLLLGLAVVFGVPYVGEQFFQSNWPAKLHVPAIFLGLFFAVFVGVAFGLYPAWRASRLDPIEALRHE